MNGVYNHSFKIMFNSLTPFDSKKKPQFYLQTQSTVSVLSCVIY